jgi:hypothetical protein
MSQKLLKFWKPANFCKLSLDWKQSSLEKGIIMPEGISCTFYWGNCHQGGKYFSDLVVVDLVVVRTGCL